jgi:hypothetical protein
MAVESTPPHTERREAAVALETRRSFDHDTTVRLLGRARNQQVVFRRVAQPPWLGVCFFVAITILALLTLAGVTFPAIAGSRFLVPFGVALLLASAVGRRLGEDSITIFEHDNRPLISVEQNRRSVRMPLDELAAVSREPPGARPLLELTDVRGSTLRIPLGSWTDEERLLATLADTAERVGAAGDVGDPVAAPKPLWVRPLRISLGLGSFASILVLVYSGSETLVDAPEPVTPSRIEQTAGRTSAPFAAVGACEVYVVPLDRPSEPRVADLAPLLVRSTGVDACVTPSFMLDAAVADEGRRQANVSAVVDRLAPSFRSRWGSRSSTVLGITELDLFSPRRPEWRFVFGSTFGFDRVQGYGLVSTARMGTGDARARRLETMAMRYLGFLHFGFSESSDPTSALYSTILGLDDLDRMRLRFSDPPPSVEELRAARARLVGSG